MALRAILRKAKKIAKETADQGGASMIWCTALAAGVRTLAAGYGKLKFADTLYNAADNLLAVPRHAAHQQQLGDGRKRLDSAPAQHTPKVHDAKGHEGLCSAAELCRHCGQAGTWRGGLPDEGVQRPHVQHV